MSLTAMIWALEKAPVDDPTSTLVLVALADSANDDGTGAWPSVTTLALRARCSERSVQRHLKALRDLGLVRLGNQALVAGYRPDRRPTVYDLNLRAVRSQTSGPSVVLDADTGDSQERGDNLSPRQNGVTPTASRGDAGGANGVTPMSPKQSLEQSYNGPVPLDQPLALVVPDDGFTAFWSAYPRKAGKGAARKAWTKALKIASADVILAAACRFRDDPNRDAQFTAHPATWLNQERWDDAPLPPRSGGKTTRQQEFDRQQAVWAANAATLSGSGLREGIEA